MCEASLVVHTASCPLIPMREVGHKKPRSSNLCDYGIVDLIDSRITVDSLRLESAVPNRRGDSLVIRSFYRVIEPHCHESLRSIGVS